MPKSVKSTKPAATRTRAAKKPAAAPKSGAEAAQDETADGIAPRTQAQVDQIETVTRNADRLKTSVRSLAAIPDDEDLEGDLADAVAKIDEALEIVIDFIDPDASSR